MAYALWATYGHLPMKPLSIPSTPLRTRKHSFNLRNSDHFLYDGFTCLPATKPVSPVVRAVDKSASPSTDDKRGAKILKGAAGASLVLACAIGVFNCSCNLKPNAIAISPSMPGQKAPLSEPGIQVFGGKYALNSLLEVTTNLTSDKVKALPDFTFKLPPDPSTEDIKTLKREAVLVIKYGNIDKAMKELENAYNHCKTKSLEEQAYEADMAIAELLLIQGKYGDAWQRECLASDKPRGPRTDTRFSFYMVIVHTMLGHKDKAEGWWRTFVGTIGKGSGSSGPPS